MREPSRMTTKQSTPFEPHLSSIDCKTGNSDIFRKVAEHYDGSTYLTNLFVEHGGTRQHINHLSRNYCQGTPIDYWFNRNNKTVDDVIKILIECADNIEG